MKFSLITALLAAPLFLFQGQDEAPTLPAVGQPAPTFRLNDHTGELATVGGEADRWTVVAFYPKALTPG